MTPHEVNQSNEMRVWENVYGDEKLLLPQHCKFNVGDHATMYTYVFVYSYNIYMFEEVVFKSRRRTRPDRPKSF